MKFLSAFSFVFLSLGFVHSSVALNCGDTLISNYTMTQDLDCTGYTGTALRVVGNNIRLRGNGYRIIAPQSPVVLYVEGSNNRILDLTVEGGTSSIGIQAYNSPSLRLKGNTASNMRIGVDLTSDQLSFCGRQHILGNTIKNSSLIGLKLTRRECTEKGQGNRIKNNDFSDSQGWAINANAGRFWLNGNQNNAFDGSQNAVLISDSVRVRLRNLDFSTSSIQSDAVFVSNVDDLRVTNSNFSGTHNAGIGLHLYDVAKAVIKNVTINNRDVGLKLAIENRNLADIKLVNNTIKFNQSLGVLLTSFSASIYQRLLIKNSEIVDNLGPDIYLATPINNYLEQNSVIGTLIDDC